MDERTFEKYKKDILSKQDKSSKGFIDEKILELCNYINSKKELLTLSSCSGRVSLLEVSKRNNKKESKWLIVTHNLAKLEEFHSKLVEYNGENKVYFKQESSIIHICVIDLEKAEKLIEIAKKAGFNRCGIITARKKIVVELICSSNLYLPVFNEKTLIDKEYLNELVEDANNRQEYSWSCINKFKSLLGENTN